MSRSPVQRLLNVTKWPTDCRVSTWICYFSHHFWHCTKFNARPFFLTTEVRSFFCVCKCNIIFCSRMRRHEKKCQKKSAKMMTGSFLRYLHVSLAYVIYFHNLWLFKSQTKIKISASCNFLQKAFVLRIITKITKPWIFSDYHEIKFFSNHTKKFIVRKI